MRVIANLLGEAFPNAFHITLAFERNEDGTLKADQVAKVISNPQSQQETGMVMALMRTIAGKE